MPAIYDQETKTNRMLNVVAAIDSAGTPGKIEFGTTGMGAVLAEVELAYPCAVVSGNQLAFFGLPATIAAIANGNIAAARIRDGNDNIRVDSLTVGIPESQSDITVNNPSVVIDQSVIVDPITINHG